MKHSTVYLARMAWLAEERDYVAPAAGTLAQRVRDDFDTMLARDPHYVACRTIKQIANSMHAYGSAKFADATERDVLRELRAYMKIHRESGF